MEERERERERDRQRERQTDKERLNLEKIHLYEERIQKTGGSGSLR